MMPQMMPQQQLQTEIPHPDAIIAEQASHKQTARENLEKQNLVERQKLEDEKVRLNEQLQTMLQQAEIAYQKRLESLEGEFQAYSVRLEEQTQELRMRYFKQVAQKRFEETEQKIVALGKSTLQELQSGQVPNGAHIQNVRQENQMQYEQALTQLANGQIPADLLPEPREKAAEPDAPPPRTCPAMGTRTPR